MKAVVQEGYGAPERVVKLEEVDRPCQREGRHRRVAAPTTAQITRSRAITPSSADARDRHIGVRYAGPPRSRRPPSILPVLVRVRSLGFGTCGV